MARVLPHVVSVHELVSWIHEPDVRVVDVRWKLGSPGGGRAAYATGHIAGAVYADIDGDLAAEPGDGGRHPLPSPDSFERLMDRLGIGDDTRVVAYDDQGGATAARLWFLLRYFGHETGAVLDGGIAAFTGAGCTLDASLPPPPWPARFHARPRPDLVVGRAEVEARVASHACLLLDARMPERYRGDVEPIDPRPGHIPTAKNAPFAENLERGCFKAASELEANYRALGAWDRETIVYCGSGVTACHDLLALAVAGNEAAKLYPGSWSEWSRDPRAPVAVGR